MLRSPPLFCLERARAAAASGGPEATFRHHAAPAPRLRLPRSGHIPLHNRHPGRPGRGCSSASAAVGRHHAGRAPATAGRAESAGAQGEGGGEAGTLCPPGGRADSGVGRQRGGRERTRTQCSHHPLSSSSQGVPPHLRPYVWATASGATTAAASHGPDYYASIVACGEAECATAARQIDLVREKEGSKQQGAPPEP